MRKGLTFVHSTHVKTQNAKVVNKDAQKIFAGIFVFSLFSKNVFELPKLAMRVITCRAVVRQPHRDGYIEGVLESEISIQNCVLFCRQKVLHSQIDSPNFRRKLKQG